MFSRNDMLTKLLPSFLFSFFSFFYLNRDVISLAEVSEYLFHDFSLTYPTSMLDCDYKYQKVTIELHPHWGEEAGF